MGYQENWQLISKLYRVLNDMSKKKSELSWESKLQNISLPSSQKQNFDQHMNKFESVKTPLRLLRETDRIEGHKNIPAFSSTAQLMTEKIKGIVTEHAKSDKVKVRLLKNLLGINFDSKDDDDVKDFLNDSNKKEEAIVIDWSYAKY